MKTITPPRLLAAARGFLSMLAIVTLGCFASTANADDGLYTSNTNSNWSDSTRWTGGVVADGASFTATINRSAFTTTRTITVDSARTIGSVVIVGTQTASRNAIISGAQTLTLDNGASASVLSHHGWGSATINPSVLSLASDLEVINAPTDGTGQPANNYFTLSGSNNTVVSAGGLRTITTLPSTIVTFSPSDPNFWRITFSGTVADGSGQIAVRHASGYNLNLQDTPKTFTGGLYIKTGAVRTSALGNSTLGGAGNVITFEARGATDPDAVLVFHGAMTEENATVNRVAVLEAGGVIYVSEDVARAVNWTGVISGAGSLNKAGPGDLRLSGANTYTGDTIVTGGTLSLGRGNAIAAASALSLGDGVLNAAGYSQTFAGLTLTANAAIQLGSTGANTLTFGNDIDLGTYSLALTGTAQTVRFGTDGTAISSEDLSRITFNGTPVALDASGNLIAAVAPAITTQPESLTRDIGADANFTVEASGNPAPTYKWESSSNGTDWTDMPGKTDATLALITDVSMNGMQYRCTATNSAGSDTSVAATLTVNITVTFDPQGGSLGDQSTTAIVTPGSAYGALPTPTRTDFNFSGWWTEASGSGTQVTSSTIVAADATPHTLYAKWTDATVPVTPELSVDKTMLSLGQGSGDTATFNVTGNVAWAAQLHSADDSSWLSVSPASGSADISTDVTVSTVAANNTGAPRTGSVVVTGGDIVRTVIVTQLATASAGAAPETLAPGTVITLTIPGDPEEVHTLTIGEDGMLTIVDEGGSDTHTYEYQPTGDTGTIIFDGIVCLLNFEDGTFRVYGSDEDGPFEIDGDFTHEPPPPAAIDYTLSVVNGTGSGAYPTGMSVPITAVPAGPGMVFDKWVSNAGGTFANETSATTTFTMPANDTTVSATYKPASTNFGGGGGGGGAPSLLWLGAFVSLAALRAMRKKR